ncbi:MAG: hypothetical protein AB7P99_14690, partial [Vicinamibacterales bacterium]
MTAWSRRFVVAVLGVGAGLAAVWLAGVPVALVAQQTAARTTHGQPAPTVNRATSRDWPLHHHDLRSARYVDASEITAANAAAVTQKWSFKPSVVAGTFGLPDEAAGSTVLGGRNSLF